jgi:xylulokinase
MNQLLSLDLGTSSIKVLLVAVESGQVLGRGSAEYAIHRPQPNRAEQEPEEWWQAAVVAVRQALSEAGPRAGTIAAIGLSGQMHGTVLLGEAGRVLAPAVIWPDQRSQRQVQEITELIGLPRLVEITGSPIATGFQAATLRWFQQAQPDLWRQVRQVLLPKDYLRWRLTGSYATDPSDGSGALLLDVQRRDWSPELLATLDINPALLPQVLASVAVAGELQPEAAAGLGLPAGIPVVTGAADTASGSVGAGIIRAETLLLTISTGGQLILPAHSVQVDSQGRMHTFCGALAPTAEQAGWYKMAAILSAVLALRWLRDRVLDVPGEEAYEAMTAWAGQAPVGAGGLIFLPYLVGERTPHMDPEARGLLLGLTLNHGRPELVRAVMEGVTLACYDAYSVLADLGALPGQVVVAGGGARSRLWQQIVADVFGLPVQRLRVVEQSALGAALLAGGGVGLFEPGATGQAWAGYDPLVEPDRRHHERYQNLLPIFRRAYQQHRQDFRELGNFG